MTEPTWRLYKGDMLYSCTEPSCSYNGNNGYYVPEPDNINYCDNGKFVCIDCFMGYPKSKVTEEKIKHPQHYTQGIECWDYVISHKMSFPAGNVVKYVTRFEHKNGLEDLLKARAYLEKLIAVTKDPTHRGDSV